MIGFWDAVALAGPYANNLHLAPDTPSLNFYRLDALHDQSTVSKHKRQIPLQILKMWKVTCVAWYGHVPQG